MQFMRSLLFWASFPLLLPQAYVVRRNAPRFPGAAGPRRGSVGTGNTLRLLAVGDSIIAGVGAADLSTALVGQTSLALARALGCRVDWLARGRIGIKSSGLLRRLARQAHPAAAAVVLLSVGVNDITSLTRLATWKKNLGGILHALGRQYPDAVIAVAGVPPLGSFPLLPQPLRAACGMRSRAFDQATREIVSGFPKTVHVPVAFAMTPERFAGDGFHPSEVGYSEFGREMAARVVEMLRTDGPGR